jgi:hypothetical protein
MVVMFTLLQQWMVEEEEEVGETGESAGLLRESRCRAKFVSLEGCESEAVRGEARRDEIRRSRDEAMEARREEWR